MYCVASFLKQNINTLDDIEKTALHYVTGNLIKSVRMLDRSNSLLDSNFKVLIYKDMVEHFINEGRADKKDFLSLKSELSQSLITNGEYYSGSNLNGYIPKDSVSKESITKSWADYF